jgi:oligopeptide transport system permease protein
MLNNALRRLLVAVPTMLVIIAASFFLMKAAPGGPFDNERRLPPEIEKRVLAVYGLDLPTHVQFLRYLGLPRLMADLGAEAPLGIADPPPGLLQGSLGPSLKYKDKTVAQIIAEGFPTTLIVGMSSIILALIVGIALGVMAALRQNRPQDFAVMGLALVGVCLPPLVMGPILSLVFGVNLGWFGTAGLYRDQYTLYYLFLPILTLALPQIAIISRLTRASMIEAMRSNAIRTARAKGLPEWQVVARHALPVALLPIVSYLGPAIAALLSGSFVIETVFQLPGIGRNFVLGALQRDYTVVMGVVILYAGLIILFHLLADLLYGALDPRARNA